MTNLGWGSGKPNLHLDQTNKCKVEGKFDCIQASVTALDQEEGDATFLVMPGSHKKHSAFVDIEPARITCPKGSMVLQPDGAGFPLSSPARRSRSSPR